MKSLSVPLCLAGLCFLSGANVTAGTLSLSCPAEIATQQQIMATPAGWKSSVDSSALSAQQGHPAHSIGFYNGTPEEGALLAPDQSKVRGKKMTSTWVLPGKEKYWFSCNYHQTKLVLSKQLPDPPLRCEAQYDNPAHMPTKVSCSTPETGTKR